MTETVSEAAPATPKPREVTYRHRLVTRLTHWVNVLCFTLLRMSRIRKLRARRLSIAMFGALMRILVCPFRDEAGAR